MFKQFCKKIFFKCFDLPYDEDIEKNEAYIDSGLVKVREEKAIYYVIPVMASDKCIRRSIRKYGIVRGDNGIDVIRKAIIYRETVAKNINKTEMITMPVGTIDDFNDDEE